MAQSGEDVRALLERVAAEAGELRVTPFEVERRIRARRSTRLRTGAAGAAVAAAAVGVGVGVIRPGPFGLNEPGGGGTSATSSTAAGGPHLVECGKTLSPPLTTTGPREAKLSVVKVVRSAAKGTAEITVQLAATSAGQFSTSGLTPLQVLLMRDGHVVDRLASYAFRPGQPVADWLTEGPAGQGGIGAIGHVLTVTPHAPWTTQVTGPGHCPGADWATAWAGAPGYSLVAVMSLPGSPEKPGLIAAGDPLLTSTAHPVPTHGGTSRTSTTSAPPAQALAPLRAIADAVGSQGRAGFADTYSNLKIDAAHGEVLVYVTSMTRGHQILSEAKRQTPGIDLTRAVLVHAGFTKRAVDAQIAKIMTPANLARYAIVSAAAAPDGSGIQVTTTSTLATTSSAVGRKWLTAASSALAGSSGIPVQVAHGSAIRPAM